MNRRGILKASAMTALGLAILTGSAAAEQKPMKDLLVGTWTLLLVDDVNAEGNRVPGYGPNPKGTVIFGTDGRYSLQIMRDQRPKFASNNRREGTAEENKAAVGGMISHFGTYSINEGAKTLTIRIEGSSFPNWDGTQQKRLITALTDDVLTWTNPTPSTAPAGNVRAELAWRRAK
jgi:Lipocalin-like domain